MTAFRKGDKIERTFPGKEPTRGTVVRAANGEITVAWDWGGFPQVLPPEQQAHVKKVRA